jgi:Sortase domain
MRMYLADPLCSGSQQRTVARWNGGVSPKRSLDLGALATITWVESEAVVDLALGSAGPVWLRARQAPVRRSCWMVWWASPSIRATAWRSGAPAAVGRGPGVGRSTPRAADLCAAGPPDRRRRGSRSYPPVGERLDAQRVGQGHVDSRSGPAVFYRLHRLRAGDEIVVARADRSRVRFLVQRTEQYDKLRFPTDAVYYPTLTSTLRLVTCGGQFDYRTGHYRSNIIVVAGIKT